MLPAGLSPSILRRMAVRYGTWLRTVLTTGWLLVAADGRAGLVLDGSLGPKGPLGGPDFEILSDYGQLRGRNLFHSFEDFSLGIHESATFSGPESVRNVIARVTGQTASEIDGTIRSNMPEADVYLINPSGVVFGPGAVLDVPGAFAATTADYLRFDDGAEFHASLSKGSTLTAANPAAFGFLGLGTGRVEVRGAELAVGSRDDGAPSRLALVAGAVALTDAKIVGDGADFVATAVGDSFRGEVGLDGKAGEGSPEFDGRLSLTGSGLSMARAGGGGVWLRGGRIVVGASQISTGSAAGDEETGIEMDAEQELTIADSIVRTQSAGERVGGDIVLSAQLVDLSGSGVSTSTGSAGASGSIRILAGDLSLRATDVSSTSFGAAGGDAGSVEVEAEHATLSELSALRSQSDNASRSGDVRVAVSDTLTLSGSRIQSEVVHNPSLATSGAAGTVAIDAGSLELQKNSKISAQNFGTGGSGDIRIRLERGPLRLMDQSTITARAEFGSGANITIEAPDTHIVMDAGTRISASTVGGSGNGGNLTIRALSLVAGPVHAPGPIVEDPLTPGKDALITARAAEGRGGAILLDVSGFAASQARQELLSASAGRPELSGTVTVAAAQVNLASSLERLSTSLDTGLPLVANLCADALEKGQSSLTEGSGERTSCDAAGH